jgi:DNA polymerase-3 subunit gamma/tau
VIPSTFVQGETSPDVGGASPAAPKPTPAKRESVASFSDVSKMTDPRLVMRRQSMRRVFIGVMAGAVGLLALAGLCSLVRRPDAQPPTTQAKVAEPSAPAATTPIANVAPVADPPPAEPAAPAAEAAEPQVPLASAATSKTPAPRTHRPKPAPRKTRNATTGTR